MAYLDGTYSLIRSAHVPPRQLRCLVHVEELPRPRGTGPHAREANGRETSLVHPTLYCGPDHPSVGVHVDPADERRGTCCRCPKLVVPGDDLSGLWGARHCSIGGQSGQATRSETEGNAGVNLSAGGTVGPEAVGASVRAKGPPVATNQTAATARAPTTITSQRRLAATATAGGTLSSFWVSMGELDMLSPGGSGGWRGARIISYAVFCLRKQK